MRGREAPVSWPRTASIAAAATSARITMPGPPPAGVSSTVRCLPRPCSRISRTSSDQRLFVSALPNNEMPNGPGNISGNRVRTMADQPRSLDMIIVLIVFGHGHHHTAAGDVDHRHGLARESQKHTVAVGTHDLDHVAGAVIM